MVLIWKWSPWRSREQYYVKNEKVNKVKSKILPAKEEHFLLKLKAYNMSKCVNDPLAWNTHLNYIRFHYLSPLTNPLEIISFLTNSHLAFSLSCLSTWGIYLLDLSFELNWLWVSIPIRLFLNINNQNIYSEQLLLR